MNYSIVIPVYNSGDWIDELSQNINEVMKNYHYSYELILVNDCSPKKDTWEKLLLAAKNNINVTALNLSYNVGQIKALLCGLEISTGDYVITMDDDFQHSPDLIPKLIKKIEEGDYDAVITQYNQKKHSFLRKLGSKIVNNLYFKLYKKPKNITSNSFRILKKELVKDICKYNTNHPQFGPMLFSLTNNVGVINVDHRDRKYGKSGYSINHMFNETLNIIITGATFPFTMMLLLGGMVSLGSLIIGLIANVYFLLNDIKSMDIIAPFIIFLIGIVILGIGLIGRYICRLMEEFIGPEKYIIRDKVEYKK